MFWKRKASSSPTKVDKCVSTEGPRTRSIGTMTEGVTGDVDTQEYAASSAGCAEWYGAYEDDAPSAYYAEHADQPACYEELCQPYVYDAQSAYYAEYADQPAYYEELCQPHAYEAQSAYYAEMCGWYAYVPPAVYRAEW